MTPADLDALPLGSVVIDGLGGAWQALTTIDGEHLWFPTMHNATGGLSRGLALVGRPLRVVYTPTQERTDP